MDNDLIQSLEQLYQVSEEAEKLPFSERISYGSYKDSLKKEFCAFIGYVTDNTGFSENNAVDLSRNIFDKNITSEKLKRLSGAEPFKRNVQNGQTEMMRIFINIDNDLHRANNSYNLSLARNLYIIYIRICIEILSLNGSDNMAEFLDVFLDKARKYISRKLVFFVEIEEINFKELCKNMSDDRNLNDDGDDDTVVCQEVTETLDELLQQLNELTGLEAVKKDVNSMINMLKIQQVRQQRGMKATPMSLHLVFYGNPGTGKTTVARLLAKIYYRMGVLSKGHLIETDRAGLVGGYVGHTALKVKKVVKKALGGILFIDEAYTLTRSQGGNDYGQEAVDTLLKCMEDHRDDLIVIVAGYPDLMAQLLESNPGLQSRFNKFIDFADYKPDELLAVFESKCKSQGYVLTEKARYYAKNYFNELYENRDRNFANGRDVRNFFEKALARQANRLAEIRNLTNEQLTRIEVCDLSDRFSPVPTSGEPTNESKKAIPSDGKEIHRGERIDVSSYTADELEIRLSYSDIREYMELDGYAFMLGENGRVLSDNDLIFFGNEVSGDRSVRSDTFSGYPAIYVSLSRVDTKYSKIDICFSAYGDNDDLNFRYVKEPVIQIIYKGKELFRLCLNNLSKEKCLVGIEFYINKNIWKVKAVGAGYNGKLKTLCESFGVEIE